MNPKFEQALQMVYKAQGFVYGQRMLEQVSKKRVFLVITCIDMGSAVKKKVKDKTAFYQIPLIEDLIKVEELTKLFHHQTPISAIGITDFNLAKLILKTIEK